MFQASPGYSYIKVAYTGALPWRQWLWGWICHRSRCIRWWGGCHQGLRQWLLSPTCYRSERDVCSSIFVMFTVFVLIYLIASQTLLWNYPVQLPNRPPASQERRRKRTMRLWPRKLEPWSQLVSRIQETIQLRCDFVFLFIYLNCFIWLTASFRLEGSSKKASSSGSKCTHAKKYAHLLLLLSLWIVSRFRPHRKKTAPKKKVAEWVYIHLTDYVI